MEPMQVCCPSIIQAFLISPALGPAPHLLDTAAKHTVPRHYADFGTVRHTRWAWRLERKDLSDPFSSDRLVSLYRIGAFSREDVENGIVDQVVDAVPADGNPSRRPDRRSRVGCGLEILLWSLGKEVC